MKSTLCACAIAFACLSSPSQADPRADAEYIVSQSMTRPMFEGALAAQRPMIVGAIENELREKGISLPDPERFFDLFLSEFMDEFTESMRGQSASLYLGNFTGQQLEDIAAFFKSESGQAYLAATPTLMMEGATMGQLAGEQAGMNAASRLADRIEAEGLIEIDDPDLLSRLLDALR